MTAEPEVEQPPVSEATDGDIEHQDIEHQEKSPHEAMPSQNGLRLVPQPDSEPPQPHLEEEEESATSSGTLSEHDQQELAALHPLLRILATSVNIPLKSLQLAQEQAKVLGNQQGLSPLNAVREILLSQKILPADAVQYAQAELFKVPFCANLDEFGISREMVDLIPLNYAKKFLLFPLLRVPEGLWVAIEDMEKSDAAEDIGRQLGVPVQCIISTRQAILDQINRAHERDNVSADEVIESLDVPDGGGLDLTLEEPEDLVGGGSDEEPVRRLLNSVLYLAAKGNTSDIHLDPTGQEIIVRFRTDGVLNTVLTLPKAAQRTLVNRIKIMSRLDIAQHNLPQDGRTLVMMGGRRIDIRVSIMPTVHGEKSVLRMLYQDLERFDLEQLGMPEQIRTDLLKQLRTSGGIVLVSGPTGSGKTTSLYALLGHIDHQSNNIITIEDPVEYKIAGYVQTEVNSKIGLTFANALRSVLRQDPDVIMVGEMRDRETAIIAIQSALTGHKVFSTVHTNHAAATVTRLVDMGVESYLVSSTVTAVLAQRLLRKICLECREPIHLDASMLAELNIPNLSTHLNGADGEKDEALNPNQTLTAYKGKGCKQCHETGYAGRVGVYELLVMSDAVKKTLLQTSESGVVRETAIQQGMKTLQEWGLDLLTDGLTTYEELISVVQS